MNEPAAMSNTEKHEILREVCVVLIMKKRLDRKLFFQAVELVHEISHDCLTLSETLAAENNKLKQFNAELKQHNTGLAWALNQVIQPENQDTLSH